MQDVYIVSAVRTPIGSFGGALSGLTATELGAKAIKGGLEKAGVSADQVDEVIYGNVVSANLGHATARQAAIAAGIGHNVHSTTENKVSNTTAEVQSVEFILFLLAHMGIDKMLL